MTNKRFALRIHSPFPVQISMVYRSQNSIGQGIVLELSLVGCRILGSDPVVAGETLNVQLSFPTSTKPLVMERTTVKWVKGLEFGLAFKQLQPREADRLEHLLEALRGKGLYKGRPSGSSHHVKPPAA